MACQLIRDETGPDGTFGTMKNTDTQTLWKTAELQWQDNKPDVSCILPGIYQVELRNHPKHGICYEVLNVPNRTAILIHAGNFAGSIQAGEKSDFLGCIGLGTMRVRMIPPGYTQSQDAISHSKDAVLAFNAEMGGKPFMLAITNQWS